MKQLCEICGEELAQPEQAYRLKIEMYADPSPPEITQEDMEGRDFEAEMRELIEQMAGLDPAEAEAEVYESYLFTLCGRCRRRLHEGLMRGQTPFDQYIDKAGE